jgi:hypothetical protein
MARNYGARVGQTIAGNLGRGKGGKFARSGSGGGASAPTAVTVADLTSAAGMSAGELEALRMLAAGKPMSESQVATLEAAGLAQRNSDGQIVRTSAARALMTAIRRGDEQGIKEALSNAREKAAKKAKAKAPKAPKRSAEDRQAARRQTQNDNLAAAMEAIGNDDADLQAEFVSFARGEGELAEANGEMLAKQGLVEINDDGTYRLTDQGRAFVAAGLRGDKRASRDAAKRAAEIAAKKLATKEADDWREWRWVMLSTSAYRDRDGQHVSFDAIDSATGIGEGPLLWWHEYGDDDDGGLPVVLGWSDFGATHERSLIESGVFVSREAAELVEKNADSMAVSSGFWGVKPTDGVHRRPIIFAERSLMPRDRQSNYIADYVMVIKGGDMKAHKKEALVKLAGAANVEAILANVEARERAAQHIGLTAKEADAVGEIQTTGDAGEAITSSSEASGEPVVETPAAEAAPVVEIATDGQQGETDVKAEAAADAVEHAAFLLGDMTPAEFTTLLGASLAKSLSDAFSVLVPQLASAQLTTKASDDIVALTKKVDDLTKRLEDDTPRGGYRPAGDPDAIVQKQQGADYQGPQQDPGMEAALALIESLNGRSGQQA